MRVVKIDSTKILTQQEFHLVFSRLFGFPDYYGANMDAWIDCMTDLDNEEFGMTTGISVTEREQIVLQLEHADTFKRYSPELFLTLLECCACVNQRRIEAGKPAFLLLAF